MGYIHLITGNGKGKTTSSVGLTMRAVGAGKTVAFVQFDKGYDGQNEHYNERHVMRQFSDSIALFPFGCERMRPDEKFRFENVDEDFEQAQMALAKLRELIESGDYFLVVADEILSARATNLITADDVLATMCLFREHSEGREIDFVLTGRSPTTAMIEEADLVSEIQPVKHYWEQGVVAREGIEF